MPIAISGVGETLRAQDSRSIAEMVLDAVEQALADAAIGFDDVDAVVTASVDLFDGLTASNLAVTEVVGAVMKPETRIAADGICALAHASCQILAEAYETVLVVAHGKASMAPRDALTEWAMDPIYLQPLGVNFLVCAGLEAQTLASRDTGAIRRWAEIAATRRTAAGQSCSPQSVLDSPLVAAPLRAAMCAPWMDGACAVVLQRVSDSHQGVLVRSVGFDLAKHSLGDRELWPRWTGLERAFDRARKSGGLNVEDLDLLEPSARHPHQEELFARAVAAPSATIAPSGGLFGGAAPVAAGLGRVLAVTESLRQRTHRCGLAHGTWGPAGQGQAVALLEAA